MKATSIVLASRPTAAPDPQHFRTETTRLPDLADGQVLLRVLFLSLDPYMRGRMSAAKSYAEPVPVGGVMEGETVCEVVQSQSASFKEGEIVRAMTGWCSHAVMDASKVRHVDTHGAPVSTALGVLGMPGFTAYGGMKVIGQPKSGETVVVAAASGPVGSLVGQIAMLAGSRAVGIAGGVDKCAYVKDELGFDRVIDHRSPAFASELAEACPEGVDVYFENVGGHVWDAVFPLLNTYARVPVCGQIAQYNGPVYSGKDRLPATMSAILRKSLLIRGFINTEFLETHCDAFQTEIGSLVASGSIKYKEDIIDGLENAPRAFIDMLSGGNFGKLLVSVGR